MRLRKFTETFGLGLAIGYGTVFTLWLIFTIFGNPVSVGFGQADIAYILSILGISLYRSSK